MLPLTTKASVFPPVTHAQHIGGGTSLPLSLSTPAFYFHCVCALQQQLVHHAPTTTSVLLSPPFAGCDDGDCCEYDCLANVHAITALCGIGDGYNCIDPNSTCFGYTGDDDSGSDCRDLDAVGNARCDLENNIESCGAYNPRKALRVCSYVI